MRPLHHASPCTPHTRQIAGLQPGGAPPVTSVGRVSPRAAQPASAEKIQRTVYVSDLSQDLTEAVISTAFLPCGSIVDCRICGDTQGPLRFAFIEFCSVEAAQKVCCGVGWRGCLFEELECMQRAVPSPGSCRESLTGELSVHAGPPSTFATMRGRRPCFAAACSAQPCLLPCAWQAVSRSGQLVGNCIVRISPSKTAIVPVSNTYLCVAGRGTGVS